MKSLEEALLENESRPDLMWQVRLVVSGDCVSYVVWNEKFKEYLVIDPKKEDLDHYRSFKTSLQDYLCLGVIDTHTHADHISIASQLASEFHAPLIMHEKSPSRRVQVRISQQVALPSHSCPIIFIPTPGHTPDALCVFWGPFVFTGDTILYGDVGRDDLPGGDPSAHFDSLVELKNILKNETLVMPGHDLKGGRITSWATQLKLNSSLTQKREDFVSESAAFDAAPPALLKKSLFENLK